MTVTNQRLVEILTTAMEKPEIANALIQRVINTLNKQEQREWQGLTREELAEIAEFHFHGALSAREFYDDIEAKLKEKNA